MQISLIVPVFNEAEGLNHFIQRTLNSLSKFEEFELIFIDDGSTDSSFSLLEAATISNSKIKCIKLSRNFGHQYAVLAGLSKTQYAIIGIIDADLQDPPELLFDMAKKIEEGYEIVYGQRIARKGESLFKIATAKIFYRTLDLLTPIHIPRDTGDFRVVTNRAAKMVSEMNEINPFLRGLFAYTGLKSFSYQYSRDPRFAGETKYTLRKMLKFATDAILGFSGVPFKAFMRLSLIALVCAIITGIYAISKALESGSSSGWLSVFSAILFFGALNLSFLSLIGRYLISTLTIVQGRPKYVVEKFLNFN